uniref:Uncharacterized protein n=1 Tax=Anguilla anguilla TaxID=7936 RepID=A0A0E9VKC0_ANGAN
MDYKDTKLPSPYVHLKGTHLTTPPSFPVTVLAYCKFETCNLK